ncbi:hypothetical protein D3C80_1540370 [compost metagenome]
MLLQRSFEAFDAAMLQNDGFQLVNTENGIVELIGNKIDFTFYSRLHQAQQT